MDVEQILINRTELATMLGYERKKTYRMGYLDDAFPRPVRDACGTLMWVKAEVLDYIELLKKRRTSEPA